MSGTSCFPFRRRSTTAALILALVAWVAMPPFAEAQRGALTVRQNLTALVDEAATIIRGYVTSVRVEPHPKLGNLYTVVVTLKVERTLKGEPGETFSFRQFIWDIRDRYNAAGYQKGQHLLLLVIKPSPYGLASPAGLEQGRFRIERGPDDRMTAVNGAGNHGLFNNVIPDLEARGAALSAPLAARVSQHTGGPMPLDELEGIITAIAVARGK